MRVRVLGPLEVRQDQAWERVKAAKQRTMLAMLAINAGRPISVDRLIDELWPDGAVGSAVNQVHGYVWRLRKAMADHDGQVLRTQSPGYELALRPDDLDASRFERLAGIGMRVGHEGDAAQASSTLTEALALWRGPAFSDVALSTATRAEAERLDELRLSVLESRLDADLALGRHAELVPELQTLVEAEPYRERFWSQLMLALYRSGRQADALGAYRELYRRLDEALGVEPSRTVKQLHGQLLASSPELDAPSPVQRVTTRPASGDTAAAPHQPAVRMTASPVTPRQLPADIADFTGRAAFLRRLDACLPAPSPADQPGRPTLATITGPGGVGKTTLAVHWAHAVADRFTGGHLYADLRGHAPTSPRQPASVLRQFLRALGVPEPEIPSDLDEAASLYRSQLADRPMLIILDNAGSARQVRPLLPGNPACLVLVTSRDQLNGLVARDGARRLDLPRLPADESVELLAHVAGQERIGADPDAAAELAALCDHLPLALRIIAAQLAADPYATVAAQVDALSGGDRLAAIGIDGDTATNLRASLDLSYQRLGTDARRLFRLLGLVPGTTFTADAAAALASISAAEAVRVLGQLVSCHLVERRDADRYALHDLLRLYASRRCREDDEGARDQALARLLGWYIATANHAAHSVLPRLDELPGDLAALDFELRDLDLGDIDPRWLETERSNLVALADSAADRGDEGALWLFSGILRVAAAEVSVGKAHRLANAGPHPAVEGPTDIHARDVCRELLRQEAESAGLSALASVRLERHGRDAAVELLERAIAIDRAVDNRELESIHRLNLACARWRLGALRQAALHLEGALDVMPDASPPRRRARALAQLAEIYRWQGHPQQAKATAERALAQLTGDAATSFAALDDAATALAAHVTLAWAYADLGAIDLAAHHRETGVRLAENCLAKPEADPPYLRGDLLAQLAGLLLREGRHAEAVDRARQAAEILGTVPSRLALLDALLVLGAGELKVGRHAAAVEAAEAALAASQAQGARAYEGLAAAQLAELHLRRDDPVRAEALAREALAIHAETGHRPGEERAWELLAEIDGSPGRAGAADDSRHQARLVVAGTDRRAAG